jgi:hypothetical protein
VIFSTTVTDNYVLLSIALINIIYKKCTIISASGFLLEKS